MCCQLVTYPARFIIFLFSVSLCNTVSWDSVSTLDRLIGPVLHLIISMPVILLLVHFVSDTMSRLMIYTSEAKGSRYPNSTGLTHSVSIGRQFSLRLLTFNCS
ncbi:hypothetical protein EG68_03050 [Paragonimus skrjabini miyazakii]|uniref:Uncharacterized protein n=1 Tax=Paragonimus skrjabini miyazakii TaxID=59628 RepID=A0A8S9YZ35_9TREM|nr:hypothetical protein EG68_03050 [Paragonimus skrjabini miyazakii]